MHSTAVKSEVQYRSRSAVGDQMASGSKSLAYNSTSSLRNKETIRSSCKIQAAPHSRSPTTRLAEAAAVPKHQQQQVVVHLEQTNQSNPAGQQVDVGLEAFKSLIAEKRFFCTQCGKCCTGDGEVWITDEEAVRIAAHLGIPLQRFYQQYTRAYSKVEGFKLLRAKNNPPDNTCSIHKVRPLQCSTYPWWPDLMNEQEWAWEKENICEGFDHPEAPETDVTDAARQLKASTAMEYRRMLSRKPSKKQQKAAKAAAAAVLSSMQPQNGRKRGSMRQQQQQQQQQQQNAVAKAGLQHSSSQSSSASVSSHAGTYTAHSRYGGLDGTQHHHTSEGHPVVPNSDQPNGSELQQLQPPQRQQHVQQPSSEVRATRQPSADVPGQQPGNQQAAGPQRWHQRLARLQQLASCDTGHDDSL